MELTNFLNSTYEKLKHLDDGEVADYIPRLARANPDDFGISVVTADGQVFNTGDSDMPFTMQSTSKPFCFALALEQFSIDTVLERVGVEPTGEDFNSISKLDRMKRPMNPMVNSGAIAICSMLRGKYAAASEDEILNGLSRFAGHRLAIDHDTYESELDTTDGNRAITYLLRKFRVLAAPPEETLDLYVRLCSVVVTAQDLATMGATLANAGINPMTGDRCVHPVNVRHVLSVMLTCGMYNYAGQWVFDVGLPAKSGVSGAILMVVPGLMAIAVYSPRIGDRGESLRGTELCKLFSAERHLHLLDCHRPARMDHLRV